MNNKPPTIHTRKEFVFFKNTFLKASLITLLRIKRVMTLLVRAAKGILFLKNHKKKHEVDVTLQKCTHIIPKQYYANGRLLVDMSDIYFSLL